MALAAAQVTAAIAALLIGTGPGYATAAGTRVYTERNWPLTEAELPAWRVTAAAEEITAHGMNFPARNTHELTVDALGYVRDVTTVDADMHALAAQGLTALFASAASTRLSPLNCAMVLARIDREAQGDGQAAFGVVTLSLRVRFHTYSNAPETIN